ncbi:MAG: helix-turn-helix domain-containing protein [Proteobacteria bacterium]|nr:helix-turn-helix domain-containing protein [Pseudomonadota bacterium]
MNEQLGSEIIPSKLPPSAYLGHGPSYYELLDVPTNATRLLIREAYIRLRSTYASGSQALYSLVSDDEAREAMERIEEAYRVLDDELLRKDYDQLIGLIKEPMNRPQSSDLFNGLDQLDGTKVQARSGFVMGASSSNAFSESLQRPQDAWPEEANEAPRATLRRTMSFSKIKKAATKAGDPDVQLAIQSILNRPQVFDGNGLTQLRDIVGVPQSEVQERTKISIEYIKALENNDFKKLPSLVYVRGFLKIYLQYLGLGDAASLIEAYTEKFNHWRETTKPHSY